MLDLIIKNGTYPDFNRMEFVSGDLGIKDGKIVALGAIHSKGRKIIDAQHKIVSPGFIDIHMHEEDLQEGDAYIISKFMLKMGVTSCLGGNCGVQRQPIKEFKSFIDRMGGAPINYMMLAGYNTLRSNLGIDHYVSTTLEQKQALRVVLEEELSQGAFGISLGLEYSPGIDMEEALYAINVNDDQNLYVSAHYRKDAVHSLDSIGEMIKIANLGRKKFQISHLSSCSAMGQMSESLALLNSAIEENPKINFDMYPYAAFSTFIGSAVFDEGCLENWGKSYENIMLTEEPFKNIFCDKELFYKARKEYPNMLAVAFVMNETEIAAALRNKYGMVASDSIISNGQGHPRAAGTFPRVLGKYVRDDQSISLIEALRKMTLEPAKRLDLAMKSEIKLGNDADLVIFDPDTIIDGANYESLNIPNTGIDYVLINGQVALAQGTIINEKLGKFIAYNK